MISKDLWKQELDAGKCEYRLDTILDLTFHIPFIKYADGQSSHGTHILLGSNVRGSGTVWKFSSARRHYLKSRIIAGSSLSHMIPDCRREL